MKRIRDRQYRTVADIFSEIIKENPQIDGSASQYQEIENRIIYNTSEAPLCGQYRFTGYDSMDIPSANAEIGLVRADYTVLRDFFSDFYDHCDNMMFTSIVWRTYMNYRLNKVSRQIEHLTADKFISGFTKIIDTISELDTEETTAMVLEDGSIVPNALTSTVREYTYKTSDIGVSTVNGDLMVAEIRGNLIDIVDKQSANGVSLILSGNTVTECGFTIDIKTEMTGVNTLVSDFDTVQEGTKVTIQVSENRTTFITAYTGYVTSSRIYASLPISTIKQIRIIMVRQQPSIRVSGNTQYLYQINRVALIKQVTDTSCTFQTIKVDIDDDTTRCYVVTDDETSDRGTIDYTISTSEDSNGAPIAFRSIQPNTIESFVSFNRKNVLMTVGSNETDRWRITPERSFGGELYPIINDTNLFIDSDEVTVSSGSISHSELTLISEDIKVYRGVGDYRVVTDTPSTTRTINPIAHQVVTDSASSWVKQIPLLITTSFVITTAVFSDVFDSGLDDTIVVPHTIQSFNNIQITRSDGIQLNCDLIESDITTKPGSTYLRFDTEFSRDYQYTIDLVVTLDDYVTTNQITPSVDAGSIIVTIAGNEEEDLSYGVDFRLIPDKNYIELNKTGIYGGYVNFNLTDTDLSDIPVIFITYSITETDQIESKYYETKVYCTQPTILTINPFTDTETGSGNYHRIDTMDCSNVKEYSIDTGWHTIRTTQPYPNLEGQEVNNMTGVFSNAGIFIPESIDNMRPFRKSMRQVSPFLLATLPEEDAITCFAYNDGKIYVAFYPDFVDSTALLNSNTPITDGTLITARRPTLNADEFRTISYTSAPEVFLIDFPFRGTDDDRFVYLRAVLDTSVSGSTAKISKIGINMGKE